MLSKEEELEEMQRHAKMIDEQSAHVGRPAYAKLGKPVERDAYVIKDSGTRKQFASGMVRDAASDKTNYMLAFDGPMFKRWAEHLTKGAKKYAARNWMKAGSEEELSHAYESLGHHFIQYIEGDQDEDHASAIFFNVNLIEYIKEQFPIETETN